MSLLKRIEGATANPATPGSPSRPAAPAPGGGNGSGPLVPSGRLLSSTGQLRSLTGDLGVAVRPGIPPRDEFANLRARVQDKLIQEIGTDVDYQQIGEMRKRVQQMFDSILEQEGTQLTRADRTRVFEQVVADILGYGPIQPLLDDETISEVMVNGPRRVYVERKGRLQKTDVSFNDDAHVLRIIDRIISPLGRRCDESSPMVDARLQDGSRVNAIIPPLALDGPTVTIRKFSKSPLTVDDLISFGTMSAEMASFLKASVEARLNLIVSGGTGSGKTTLLNVLSSFIPDDERIITIEDSAELQLRQDHVVRLESKPANIEGKGSISIRDLVKNSLRMRPERIVVGECRGGETLDMLQAMNTGHDGSMTTAHANTPRDMLSRLETMCLMAGIDLPLRAIREQISKAIDVVVQQSRMKDGSRKITHITEIQGMEGDVIVMQDIFVYEQTGIDENGKIIGRLRPTGIRPKFIDKFETQGIHLPPSVFGADRLF